MNVTNIDHRLITLFILAPFNITLLGFYFVVFSVRCIWTGMRIINLSVLFSDDGEDEPLGVQFSRQTRKASLFVDLCDSEDETESARSSSRTEKAA